MSGLTWFRASPAHIASLVRAPYRILSKNSCVRSSVGLVKMCVTVAERFCYGFSAGGALPSVSEFLLSQCRPFDDYAFYTRR